MSIDLNRDGEHDGGQRGAWQVLQWAGPDHQHQQHDAGKYQLCNLASRARAIPYGSLRRAAVDHERSADAGASIAATSSALNRASSAANSSSLARRISASRLTGYSQSGSGTSRSTPPGPSSSEA